MGDSEEIFPINKYFCREKSESGAQNVDFVWIISLLNFRGGKCLICH